MKTIIRNTALMAVLLGGLLVAPKPAAAWASCSTWACATCQSAASTADQNCGGSGCAANGATDWVSCYIGCTYMANAWGGGYCFTL
jgi:hypothetical protein